VTPRWKFLVIAGLIFVVLGAAIYFPILRRRVRRAARLQQQSEERKRGGNWRNRSQSIRAIRA